MAPSRGEPTFPNEVGGTGAKVVEGGGAGGVGAAGGDPDMNDYLRDGVGAVLAERRPILLLSPSHVRAPEARS